MLPRVPTRALRQVTTLVSCVVAIVSVGSCDKVALLAPTESVITLVSNRAVLEPYRERRRANDVS